MSRCRERGDLKIQRETNVSQSAILQTLLIHSWQIKHGQRLKEQVGGSAGSQMKEEKFQGGLQLKKCEDAGKIVHACKKTRAQVEQVERILEKCRKIKGNTLTTLKDMGCIWMLE